MLRLRCQFASILLAAAGLPLYAADATPGEDPLLNEYSIDEIVVVAHKSGRPIREIAANVTIVSRDDVNAVLATSLGDVFRQVPGIDYESAGTRFGDEGINIRGIGGNRVAILVDGVPLGDQFDIGSFSNATRDFLNTGLIQRIEVLHGPASALYGSAAIGGVVAVHTPDPRDIAGASGIGGDVVTTWRAADQSTHGTGMLAMQHEQWGLLLGASFRAGAELDSNAADANLDLSDFRRRTAIAKWVADDPRGNTWRIGLLHQDADVRSDLNSMLGSGRFRTTTALRGDDAYEMDLASIEFAFGAPDGFVDAGVLRAYVQTTATRQSTLDERALAATPVSIDRFFSFEQDIAGIELNLQKQVELGNVSHQLGFGIEYRQRETTEFRDGLSTNLVDGSSTNVILGEQFPLRDFPISQSSEWGAYVEDTVTMGNWSVIAALRADRFRLSPENDPMYAEDYPFADPVGLEETDVSPKLGLIYRIGAETDIYVQYAHGFRAPPYEDANIGLEIPAFNFRAIPNPELRSESSNGFDLGVRWQGDNAKLRLSLYRTRYTDFIASKMLIGIDPVSGRLLFQSQNLAKTVIEGVEAGGMLRLGGALEGFAIDGSMHASRGENRENGQPLNSVGPAEAVLGITWNLQHGRRQLRLQGLFASGFDERDESERALYKPAGYGVADLYLTQQFRNGLWLRLGIQNLLDRTYWRWSDVGTLGPSDPVLAEIAQPGRNVSAAINFSW